MTCGGGNRTRHRKCDNPFAKNGGFPCVTSGTLNYLIQHCNEEPCPNNPSNEDKNFNTLYCTISHNPSQVQIS